MICDDCKKKFNNDEDFLLHHCPIIETLDDHYFWRFK